MLRHRFLLLLGVFCLISTLHAAGPSANSLLMPKEDHLDVVVTNRVLARSAGKAITMMDVMKRMDLVFYREFPEYASSKQARFQFYNARWKATLQDLIDKALIEADAEEMKMEITQNEVRQELELLFGPNVIVNLSQIDMTLDEAMNLLKAELMIRRMMTLKVNMKAFRQVGPQEVRGAYEQFAKENVKPEEWKYRFITIRDPSPETGRETAYSIFSLFDDQGLVFDDVKARIDKGGFFAKSSTVTCSDSYCQPVSEIAPLHLDVLKTLAEGSYSTPQVQESRTSKGVVYRIFAFDEKVVTPTPPLKEVEGRIRGKLMREAMEREGTAYMEYLRKHFDTDTPAIIAAIPDDLKPFVLLEKGK